MTLPCEASFGVVRGREIQDLVQESTGVVCPCIQGQPCPLLCQRTKDVGLAIPDQNRRNAELAELLKEAAAAG